MDIFTRKCASFLQSVNCVVHAWHSPATGTHGRPHLQIPREITVLDTHLYYLLPLEVAWWFLWRYGLMPGGWVAVISNKPQLVGALMVRAGTGLNVLWGIPEADVETEDELNPYVDALQMQLRVADGLPPVQWNQGFTGFVVVFSIVGLYAHFRVLCTLWTCTMVTPSVFPLCPIISSRVNDSVTLHMLPTFKWSPGDNNVMRDIERHVPINCSGRALVHAEEEEEEATAEPKDAGPEAPAPEPPPATPDKTPKTADPKTPKPKSTEKKSKKHAPADVDADDSSPAVPHRLPPLQMDGSSAHPVYQGMESTVWTVSGFTRKCASFVHCLLLTCTCLLCSVLEGTHGS